MDKVKNSLEKGKYVILSTVISSTDILSIIISSKVILSTDISYANILSTFITYMVISADMSPTIILP